MVHLVRRSSLGHDWDRCSLYHKPDTVNIRRVFMIYTDIAKMVLEDIDSAHPSSLDIYRL